MRLDKFLKVSRILKRRTVAQDACEAGKVDVNGKPSKSGHKLKIGDIVTIHFATSDIVFRVKMLSETVKKQDVEDMYEIITE